MITRAEGAFQIVLCHPIKMYHLTHLEGLTLTPMQRDRQHLAGIVNLDTIHLIHLTKTLYLPG